jgi:hypothetical protein
MKVGAESSGPAVHALNHKYNVVQLGKQISRVIKSQEKASIYQTEQPTIVATHLPLW